jgi:hypothetical protein
MFWLWMVLTACIVITSQRSLPAGNVILLGRDKGAEMVLEIQSTACRD